MQDMQDQDTVHEYGQGEPTFGGMYFDGDVLVAMFTRNLDLHADRLTRRLHSPGQFRVQLADRSYVEVEASNGRVQRRLMMGANHPGVVGVGIAMEAGQFVIRVSVEGVTEEVAEEIRAAVAPDRVVIRLGARPYRL